MLLVDGLPVSFEPRLRSGTRFQALVTEFHAAFEPISLTRMNRYLSFAACRDPGIEVYDFGRGGALAKRVWASGARGKPAQEAGPITRFVLGIPGS